MGDEASWQLFLAQPIHLRGMREASVGLAVVLCARERCVRTRGRCVVHSESVAMITLAEPIKPRPSKSHLRARLSLLKKNHRILMQDLRLAETEVIDLKAKLRRADDRIAEVEEELQR